MWKATLSAMPVWAWYLIALGVACAIIAIVIINCIAKIEKPASKGEPIPMHSDEEKQGKPVEEEQAKAEEVVEIPAPEPVLMEEPQTAPVEAAVEAPETAEPQPVAEKIYHISKRKEDKKWQVKLEGADKALRLFFTQNDAIEFAKKSLGKQNGHIVVHKEGGGERKI